jgi:hypothetical protein
LVHFRLALIIDVVIEVRYWLLHVKIDRRPVFSVELKIPTPFTFKTLKNHKKTRQVRKSHYSRL